MENLMTEVVKKIDELHKTISTMESCTGGRVASEITNISGASDILKFSEVDTAIVQWNEKYAYFMVKPIQDYYFDSDVLGHAIEYSKVS